MTSVEKGGTIRQLEGEQGNVRKREKEDATVGAFAGLGSGRRKTGDRSAANGP